MPLIVQNYVEYFKVCWKTSWKFQGMLKTVICVENYVETACWTFQCVLKSCNASSKLCWIFQGMLKTVICIENYVETACWKFQCVLKTVMHVENYVEISRCVENVYVRHVENCVEIRKNHHHTLRCMLKLSGRGPKIRRQTARFDSEFTCVSEVRHIFICVCSCYIFGSGQSEEWNVSKLTIFENIFHFLLVDINEETS